MCISSTFSEWQGSFIRTDEQQHDKYSHLGSIQYTTIGTQLASGNLNRDVHYYYTNPPASHCNVGYLCMAVDGNLWAQVYIWDLK